MLWSLLAVTVAMLWPYRHFAGDDAYISFRFAENLASGAGYSFNAGEPTYGSTAPLWVLLMAALHRAGMTIANGAHLLNWCFALLCVPALWSLTGFFPLRPVLRWLTVLFFVLNPWFVRWAMSAMENDLALFLWLTATYYQLRSNRSERFNWISPVCAALATLNRPEMAVFAALLFLDTLLHSPQRTLLKLLAGGALYVAILSPWLWYAQANFGTIVPNTISAKISRAHAEAFTRTLLFLGSFWVFQGFGLALALVLGRYAILSSVWKSRSVWFVPAAWGLALPAFYVVGGAPVAGRYLVFGLPSYLLLGGCAWEYLLRYGAARGGFWKVGAARGVAVLAVATLAMIAVVQRDYCWYITKWTEGMDPRMIEMARYLRDHSRPTDVVACDQIGVMGYFSERRVLDIVGLISPEMIQHRQGTNAVWHYVRERAPQFLFLTDQKPLMVSRDPGYASAELLRVDDIQREGGSGRGSLAKYYLYRTNW
jgi:hypothetical protein